MYMLRVVWLEAKLQAVAVFSRIRAACIEIDVVRTGSVVSVTNLRHPSRTFIDVA